MVITRTYTSAVKLTEDTWKYSSQTQKEEILNSLNLDESWAKTKTISEMVNRGGGIVANELKNLSRMLLKKKGGEVTITWRT